MIRGQKWQAAVTSVVLLNVNLPSKVQYVLEMNVKKAICDAKLIIKITVPRTKYALYCNNGQTSWVTFGDLYTFIKFESLSSFHSIIKARSELFHNSFYGILIFIFRLWNLRILPVQPGWNARLEPGHSQSLKASSSYPLDRPLWYMTVHYEATYTK